MIAPQRIFAAFEGGGAKALVHVGALSALESQKLSLAGLAGTSAGAIVAALKAIGYSPDEIISPRQKTTILDLYSRLTGISTGPLELFGHGGWERVRLARFLFRWNQSKWFLYVYGALLFLVGLPYQSPESLTAIALVFSGTAPLVIVVGSIYYLNAGVVSARRLRDVLNRLFAHKLFPGDPTRIVTMGDLADQGCPRLRIVAADVSTRALRLFSSDAVSDRNIPLADAVAASVCIPFLFKPWLVLRNYHVDGGIVSNMPAWPFDEERALDADAITVAFEIENEVQTFSNLRRGWFSGTVMTALFGSGILNKRAVDRLEVISLRTDLELLAFDVAPEKAFATVAAATLAAQNQLSARLVDRPKVYTDACEALRAKVLPLLDSIPGGVAHMAATRRARVSVAFPEVAYPESIRMAFSAGFEDDADENLLLPRQGSVTGAALLDEDYILMTPPFDDIDHPGSRRLMKLFAKDIRWIFAAPIYGGQETPSFVVAIDGSDTLTEDEPTQFQIIDVLAAEAERLFMPIAQALP